MFALPPLLLALALLPVLAFFVGRHLLRPRPIPGIALLPGSVALFGHGLQFVRHVRGKADVGSWFADVLDRSGSPTPRIAQFLMSFNTPYVVIADVEQIERLHASADWDKSDASRQTFGGLFPLATIARKTDSLVRAHRRAFAYSHSPAFLSLVGTYFSSHLDLLLAQWGKAASEGTFFPVSADLKLLMTDTIAQISFGESFNQLATGHTHEVGDALDYLFNCLSPGSGAVFRHWLKRLRPTYQRNYRIMDRYISSRVAHARSRITDGGEIEEIQCMIDIIMRKEARDGLGNTMPEDELRDELLLTLVAGEETSASAQLWTLKILSERPDLQRKLHYELGQLLPHPSERAPTTAEVHPTATPYLEAVVHEILRFQHVTPFTIRQALRDTTLLASSAEGDEKNLVTVPAGTTVIILQGRAARQAALDGDIFRPERWLDETTGQFDATRVWTQPFGGGNRACYGYRMALVFLRLFIAQLSLTYFVLPLPDELKTDQAKHLVTRRPIKNFVGLKRWEDIEGPKEARELQIDGGAKIPKSVAHT